MRKILFIFILFIAYFNANAGNIRLIGTWGFAIDPVHKTVNITGDKMENVEEGNYNTIIKVKLLLTEKPFSGDKETGFIIGESDFEPLLVFKSYENIDKTSDFLMMPPPGSYNVVIIVEELTTDGYIITDYRNFDEKVKF